MQSPTFNSIEFVKAKFDEWRTTRQNKSAKIPEPLWDDVKQLYPQYSFAQISKTLGLSSLQLKSKLNISVSNVKQRRKLTRCQRPKLTTPSYKILSKINGDF